MMRKIIQYYYKRDQFGGQVLWVKEQVQGRKYDVTLGVHRNYSYVNERKARAAEAALLLPVLNAGMKPAS